MIPIRSTLVTGLQELSKISIWIINRVGVHLVDILFCSIFACLCRSLFCVSPNSDWDYGMLKPIDDILQSAAMLMYRSLSYCYISLPCRGFSTCVVGLTLKFNRQRIFKIQQTFTSSL